MQAWYQNVWVRGHKETCGDEVASDIPFESLDTQLIYAKIFMAAFSQPGLGMQQSLLVTERLGLTYRTKRLQCRKWITNGCLKPAFSRRQVIWLARSRGGNWCDIRTCTPHRLPSHSRRTFFASMRHH